jgi:hypothetical protein
LIFKTSSNDIHRYFTSLDVECEGKIAFNDVCLLLSYLVTRNKKQALPVVLRTLENGLNSAPGSAANSPTKGKLHVEFSGIESSAGGSAGGSQDASDDDDYSESSSDDEEDDNKTNDNTLRPDEGDSPGGRFARRKKPSSSGRRRAWLRCCFCCWGRGTAYQVHPGGPPLEDALEPPLPLEETEGHHPKDCMCGCRRIIERYDNGG